jgi:hypothetical protein
MSSYSYGETKPPKEPDGDDKPCADCDLSGFDSVNCEVEGVAAEAEYMKQYQEKLKQRRAQFDTARTAYDKARLEVAVNLAQIRKKLKRLKDQLDCQLDEQKRRCLYDAWREVAEKLKKCGGEGGCCVTEEQCNFSWELPEDATPAQIRALIEDFDRRVVKAEDCFDNVLVKEPDELKKRVTELLAFVDEIDKAASDTKTTDYSEVYAKLLWAEYRAKKIWLGFDNPSDYVDCLCRALKCSLDGRRALAKLNGLRTTRDCVAQGEADRCKWLNSHVVEEILAAYRCLCPPKNDDQQQTEQSESTV